MFNPKTVHRLKSFFFQPRKIYLLGVQKNSNNGQMQVKIWGTRGSLPAPLTPEALTARAKSLLETYVANASAKQSIDFFLNSLPPYRLGGYGGNTPCLTVNSGQQSLIIDAGTGIRTLGYELLNGPCGKGQGEVHLLFTHFHWDHIMGLPFFTPLFIPGNKIHVYAVQPDLPEVFKTVFKKPYFPVPLEQLPSQIEYHRLEPRQPAVFQDLTVTPYELDHPDPCWGYKIQQGKRTLAYCVDTEGARISRERLGDDLPLYQNVDVLVFDAQYTLLETMEKINWGHAAASMGIDLAIREKIKRVIFMHHDPASADEKIAMAEAEARRYYKSRIKELGAQAFEVDWCFAQEGIVFEV
jgi:phosphoribosyl 1,2-cyclic phosphodiesterase